MKQKSLFDVWGKIRVSHLNRLLRPFNVRLVEKKSKAWGDKVVITAEVIPAVEVKPATPSGIGPNTPEPGPYEPATTRGAT